MNLAFFLLVPAHWSYFLHWRGVLDVYRIVQQNQVNLQ